jgi:hypothetical protein
LYNDWITLEINTSCQQKRKLYLEYRNSKNLELKRHYQVYCKILYKVIKGPKIMYYNKQILKSRNKCKTTWDIIKELSKNNIQKLIYKS